MKLHEKIKKLRKEKGWSQNELSDKIGVHTTHFSRLERGKFQPSIDVIKGLAEAFAVTADYLLFDEKDEIEKVDIKDKSLFEKVRMIDTLDEEDKNTVMNVIESMLTKKRMWEVLRKEKSA